MDKTIFLLAHYAALLLFVWSCWGVGNFALRALLRRSAPLQRWLVHGLQLCAGVGIVICALQALGIVGLLTLPWLIALLTVGWTAAALQGFGSAAPMVHEPAPSAGCFLRLHWTVWLLLLLGLGLVAFPLQGPYAWDELMYHLPHAREWAKSGKLQINDWLRYPYFPYNYHLLFAAALVLYDDVMPHLLHALAGWTTALLLYQLALRQTGRVAACMAAIAWLALARTASSTTRKSTWRWRCSCWPVGSGSFCGGRHRRRARPAGSCWQRSCSALPWASNIRLLSFVPFIAVAVLLRERRPKTLLWVLAAGLLPCVYWYLRNALLTGDPFHPLGGNFFGFSDWNRADLAQQLQTVRDVRDWPDWLLWPALIAPLLPSTWRHPGLRIAMGFGACAFVVWMVTSHYSRYLLPAYPILLLLAAHVVSCCAAGVMAWLRARSATIAAATTLERGRLQGFIASTLLLVALQTTTRSLTLDWARIATTPAQRDAHLSAQLGPLKETLDFLKGLPGARIYQIGLEGALYYAPQPIYGDHFGRWRYIDFVNLSSPKLAARLAASGFNTLALLTKVNQHLFERKDFLQCFDAIHEDAAAKVFKIRTDGDCIDSEPDGEGAGTHSIFVIGPSLKGSR